MDWYPKSDEELLFRASVVFASGMAPSVAGCRWFRDAERNDIQDELPGWPAGPIFTPNSKINRAGRRIGRALAVGVPLVGNIFANVIGASGSPFGSIPVRENVEDPDNEVHDFPVMWAAPGTVARTVPWQLDPARRANGYGTDMVLTNRRAIFLGTHSGTLDKADELWEIERDGIAEARKMPYSEISADLRVTFKDQSWVRLFTGSPDIAERLAQLVNGATKGLAESDLTTGQRNRVKRFRSSLPKNAGMPTYALLPSGIILVEVQVPAKVGNGIFETHSIMMDASGDSAKPRPGDST